MQLRFYLYYMQSDFSNCRKVIEYADRVLGSNAAESLRNWKALGMLSSNRSVQPNEYVNADNQANLLLISADSYWPLVADPGYGACEKYCSNNITAAETCKSTGPWGHKPIIGKNLLPQEVLLKMAFADWLCIRNIQRRVIVIRGIWCCRHLQLTKLYFGRAEAYTLLKQYDKAAEDIDAWQKAFTKTRSLLQKNRLIASMQH